MLAAEKATKDLQEALAEHYCESYKDSMFTYDTEEHRVDLSEIYVPIQWETREKSTEGVTEMKLESYRDILHRVRLHQYKIYILYEVTSIIVISEVMQLFQDSTRKPVRVIVKGEPASGKTAFMKKICQEWSMLHTRNEEPVSSEIRDTLGQYDLLIPIILRLVKRGASLEETIEEQIDLNDKQMFTLRYMLKKTEKTILVLDGLDEYNTKTSRDITNSMQGNTFKHVIITSRAEAANKTKEWKNITYKEAELKGFSDENIKLYVEKFFKTSKKLATTLISHIFQKDSNLLELARNPGSLSMLCILHKDKIPIHAMNREQLYEEFVAFLLSRWEQRQNTEGEKTPRSKILKKYHKILVKFGELANINRKTQDDDDNSDFDESNDSDENSDSDGDDEDSMELSFTTEQVNSIVGQSAFQFGFLYRSHLSSRFESSRFSFTHKTIHEYFLAHFISHSDLEPFKQRLYKNRELLKQELSLIRFLLHLLMSPKEAYKFTTNIIGSNPDKDLFIVLLKLYQEYQHDEYKHQATLTFNTTEKDIFYIEREYSYIYQYPCYVIRAHRRHEDSLSSFNKDMIRRMNTDNKHKAVTVPLLQTASRQVISCKYNPWDLFGCDFCVYCRADYEVTVTGDGSKLEELYLEDIEKMGDINLNPVNNNLKVNIYDTNLHGHVVLTKPWMALIQELAMSQCKLEAGDISVIADSIQACTSPRGAQSASPCRLQKLYLYDNSLAGAGADIARIISCIPLCRDIYLSFCDLNDEEFHAIVNAIIQTHSDRHTSVHDHSTPDRRQTKRFKPASPQPASHIERLLLHDSKFSDVETVRLLLDNLPPSLRHLDLSYNQFNKEEIEEIRRTYKDKHPNLILYI